MRLRIRQGSLRTKIITWSFVPTAIILVAVALVTLTAYQKVTEDLVIERDQELTRLSANRLATELTQYTNILATSARTTGTYIHPAVQRITLQRVSERLAVFDGGVLVLDAFGMVVATEPERPDALGQNWSERSYYSRMLSAREPVFSNVVTDGPGNAEVIVIAVPIISPQDEFLGIVAGMLRLGTATTSAFYDDIVKSHLGENGSAYLVDGNGRVIFHSDTGRSGDDFSLQPVVQKVLGGQMGAIRSRDFEGQDIVASFSPVPGTPWGLVTEENWSALISPSQSYRQFLLLLLVLGVLVPALVVAVGVRRITRPITELIGAVQAVAGGDFDQRITANTGDEVEELAEQFSQMSVQLQESYTNLERRVADRTKELAALNAIAAVVSRSLDLQEILNNALDKTLEVMETEVGGIYLLNENTNRLTISAHCGFDPEFVAEIDNLKLGEGFSGRVAQSGHPLVVSDISTDPRLTRLAARQAGFHSLVSIPLSSKGKILGTLFAVTYGYREFSEQNILLLTSIGNQIGVAIDNAHLFEAERRRRQEAILLAEVAKLISGTLDLDEVLRLTAEFAVDVFDVHCCCIFQYDEQKKTLAPAVFIEADSATASAKGYQMPLSMAQAEFTPSQTMHQTVIEDLQPLIVEDVPADPHLSPSFILNLQSALVVPLEAGGRRLGAMQLGTQPPRRRRFTDEEGELALAMANQAAVAIESARLFKAEQRRAEEFRVISEVGRRITSILAVDELLGEIAHLLKETLGYYLVGIALIEEDELVFRAGAGAVWELPDFRPPRLKVGQEGITGWVAASGKPLLVPDVSQEPHYYSLPEASEIRSELAVPLETKEAVIGVLHVQSDRVNAFNESDMVMLQSLADQAALVIENAQLYEQAQHVATLEERQRLARELHDSVTQALYGVTLYAEAAARLLAVGDAESASDHLREVRQTAQEALREMRLLIFELRPPVLEQAGLVAALEMRLEAVEGRSGLETKFDVEGEIRLPPDIEEGLYRIAQEALNNALKHAQAQCIKVHLCQEERAVMLEVSDDGIGFDTATAREQGGMGLIGMDERATRLGAWLTVDSGLGVGTSVRVEVGL